MVAFLKPLPLFIMNLPVEYRNDFLKSFRDNHKISREHIYDIMVLGGAKFSPNRFGNFFRKEGNKKFSVVTEDDFKCFMAGYILTDWEYFEINGAIISKK